jgi:lysozyme family protein
MYLDPRIADVLKEGLRREGWPAPARSLVSDRGGLTRGGITAASWGEWLSLGRPATAEELDAITEAQALEFYYARYVALPGLDRVNDQQLRALLIDWAFTSSPDDPIKALQQALRSRDLYDGAIDGILGTQTKTALFKDRDPRATYRRVLAARVQFYLDLAIDAQAKAFLGAHPSTQLHNLRGWTNRCLEFLP